MKDSFNHRRHMQAKALKEAGKIKDSGPLPDEMIINPNFRKKFQAPKVITEKISSKKAFSKRELPDHTGKEGEKWNSSLQKQNKERSRALTKKLSKQKF